jgi:hypothetical protein
MKSFKDFISGKSESGLTDEEHGHLKDYVKHKVAAQRQSDTAGAHTPGGRDVTADEAGSHDKAAMEALNKIHKDRVGEALKLGNQRVNNILNRD